MKDIKFIFPLLVLLVIIFKINTQVFKVIPVYPYCINGTAFIAYLEDYDDKYLYFHDDFYDSCTTGEEEVKYYELNSEIRNLINSENLLNYAMIKSKKSSYDVKLDEIKDLDWKPINQTNPGKSRHSWFYKVEKEEDKNIVLFRLAKNGNKKGSVSMYTLMGKP